MHNLIETIARLNDECILHIAYEYIDLLYKICLQCNGFCVPECILWSSQTNFRIHVLVQKIKLSYVFWLNRLSRKIFI